MNPLIVNTARRCLVPCSAFPGMKRRRRRRIAGVHAGNGKPLPAGSHARTGHEGVVICRGAQRLNRYEAQRGTYHLRGGTIRAEEMETDPGDRILAQELMNRLPQNLKLPVYLKYYQDYNSAEIGRMMNLPAATVRTRLRTAFQMMREMMKGEF